MTKVAVIQANIGNFDPPIVHEKQSIPCDFYMFDDTNFKLRDKVFTPMMQAKIPKCFGWQLTPGYDYYLWMDGRFALKKPDSLKYYLDLCQGYDMVVMRHYRRPSIYEEWRYIRRGLWQSPYIITRYENEFLKEQWDAIVADKEYKDDLLLAAGIFMYKNTPQVQSALKEWWYYITRYLVMDQLAFAYVLKKAGLKLKIIDESHRDNPNIQLSGHIRK